PTTPSATYPLSLHDALPIYGVPRAKQAGFQEECEHVNHSPLPVSGGGRGMSIILPFPCREGAGVCQSFSPSRVGRGPGGRSLLEDRKSTRLNSSHVKISYAV